MVHYHCINTALLQFHSHSAWWCSCFVSVFVFVCIYLILKSTYDGSGSVFLSTSRADHEFCLQFNVAAWLKDTSTTWKFPCETQDTNNTTRR